MTKPQPQHGRYGLADWFRATAEANLDKDEKATLYALLYRVDWKTGTNAYPSMAGLARLSGYSVNGTRSAVKRLVERGVVVIDQRSNGGTARGGKPATHLYRLNFDAIRQLAHGFQPSSGWRVEEQANPPLGEPQPSTPCASTLQKTHVNPPVGGEEHSPYHSPSSLPVNHHHNPPTQTPPPAPTSPATTAGGGCGGLQGNRFDSKMREQTMPRRIATLTEAGCSIDVAQRIARQADLSADHLTFIRAECSKENIRHPGRLASKLAGMPVGEWDGWPAHKAKAVSRRLASQEERISRVLTDIRDRADATDSDRSVQIRKNLDMVHSVWPDASAIIAAIDADELACAFEEQGKGNGAIDPVFTLIAHRAARAVAGAESVRPSLPPSSTATGQAMAPAASGTTPQHRRLHRQHGPQSIRDAKRAREFAPTTKSAWDAIANPAPGPDTDSQPI